MSFHYTAYGLRLSSQRELPGLQPVASPFDADVEIVWRSADLLDSAQRNFRCAASSTTVPGLFFHRANNSAGHWLFYEDGPSFVVGCLGDRVAVHVTSEISDETVATYLLGPVLGFVLRLRRMLCLHASAVAIDSGVVAFAGPAGSGKSTWAAAFAARGYPILADDKVVLVSNGCDFWAQPGAPRLRLWPDTADAVVGHHADLPRILPEDPTFDKRYLDFSRLPGGFAAAPLPLTRIFLLGARAMDAHLVGLRRIHPHPALIGLAANTYMNHLADRTSRAWEFDALARVVERTPVYFVTPPTGVPDLAVLYDAILDCCAQTPAPSLSRDKMIAT